MAFNSWVSTMLPNEARPAPPPPIPSEAHRPRIFMLDQEYPLDTLYVKNMMQWMSFTTLGVINHEPREIVIDWQGREAFMRQIHEYMYYAVAIHKYVRTHSLNFVIEESSFVERSVFEDFGQWYAVYSYENGFHPPRELACETLLDLMMQFYLYGLSVNDYARHAAAMSEI